MGDGIGLHIGWGVVLGGPRIRLLVTTALWGDVRRVKSRFSLLLIFRVFSTVSGKAASRRTSQPINVHQRFSDQGRHPSRTRQSRRPQTPT